MTATPYLLSALGIINALGSNKQQVLANLLTGQAPGMRREHGWVPGKEVWCGQVMAELPAVPFGLKSLASRNNQLLLAALSQIQQEVDRAIAQYGCDRIAVVLGSSTSGILEGEKALHAAGNTGLAPADYHYRQQEIGAPAIFLAEYLALEGPAYTLSTACSSSAKVFACARNLMELGVCDAVITGGADSLCKLTLNGFSALDSVSDDLCNPFSANRRGITIGEGAALFLMERGMERGVERGMEREGVESDAVCLLGVGESADAHHISSPHPEGVGAAEAMQRALDDADLKHSDIHYLNLHGTATPQNDAMESLAVARVLGDAVPCSSTKPLTGHTLGAAGANELGLCWLLLGQEAGEAMLPRQLWDGEGAPALPAIGLLDTDRLLPAAPLRMMSNSFAFGGSNCCVIIGRS